MKLLKIIAPLAAVSLVFAQGESALQKAIRKETLEGDVKGAIESYKRLAQDKDRTVAARALVRMGECYEKLGDSEARKAYERVVHEFGDQKPETAAANARLAGLAKPAATVGPVTRVVASSLPNANVWASAPSPDGHYLLQSGSQGLSLRDLRTGQTRILSKLSPSIARFSNDGSRIAFIRWVDRVVEAWVVSPDGSGLRKLWEGERSWKWAFLNAWFPDNKRFLMEAYLDDQTSRLIAVSATDGSSTKLWEGSGDHGFLSPDGNYVAFSKRISRDPIKDELRLLSVADLSESLLLSNFGPAVRQIWTPDGKGLVFLSDRRKPGQVLDLWYLAVANGKAQGRPELVKTDFGDVPVMAPITRDGALFYTQNTDMREVLSVEVDPATGKGVGTVTISGQGAGPAGQGIYSPDGHWLAYHRHSTPVEVLHNLDTGEEKIVPAGLIAATEQAWFPDGRSLLVNGRRSANDPLGLHRVDAATGAATLLKRGPVGAVFVFSPDGKTVYYSQRLPGEDQTRVMAWEIETGKERELMRGDGFGPTHWIALAVSPDGKQLATARVDGHEHVIETQLLAGGGRHEVYRVRDTQALHELVWTPDGRYLIFSMRNADQEGLWRISVTGGSPQEMGISAPAIGKVSLHPDGRHIAFVAAQGGFQVMALENFLPKAIASK
jgi:Tol biopolymer transport system component